MGIPNKKLFSNIPSVKLCPYKNNEPHFKHAQYTWVSFLTFPWWEEIYVIHNRFCKKVPSAPICMASGPTKIETGTGRIL
jgi:hypothetical protein